MEDHAVIVNAPLQGASGEFENLHELGDQLAARVEAAGVGELDGDLIGEDLGILYLYGPDADRVWLAIEDLIRAASLPAGAHVIKRYGPPGSPETQIDL